MTETTNNKDITQLLQSVTAIKSKYDEINRITGADYNIFNVLKLQRDEVRLHSRFIGDLLNPKGKHGLGDVFLELFIRQLVNAMPANILNEKYKLEKSEPITDEELKNILNIPKSKVIIEQYIGLVKTDEGGRIDLVITDGNKTIVIENKIYAEDQEQQLIRYYNKYPNALMIYLTLDGKEATPISVTSKENDENDKKIILDADVDYIRMSYEENIINWLEECLTHTTQYPFLRESTSQYLNIVKQLTGQAMNKKMDNEIKNAIIESPESYKTAELISKNLNNARSAILGKFRSLLEEKVCANLTEYNIDFEVKLTDMKSSSRTKTQLVFNNDNNIDTNIIFEISRMLLPNSKNSKKYHVNPELYYGFRYDNSNNQDKQDEIDKFKIINSNFESNKWWLAKLVFKNDFNNSYIELANNEVLNNNVTEVAEKINVILLEYFGLKTNVTNQCKLPLLLQL